MANVRTNPKVARESRESVERSKNIQSQTLMFGGLSSQGWLRAASKAGVAPKIVEELKALAPDRTVEEVGIAVWNLLPGPVRAALQAKGKGIF